MEDFRYLHDEQLTEFRNACDIFFPDIIPDARYVPTFYSHPRQNPPLVLHDRQPYVLTRAAVGVKGFFYQK